MTLRYRPTEETAANPPEDNGISLCSYIHLDAVDSTNNYLRRLLDQGEVFDGVTLVVADSQTRGRGQIGNSWESEDGKNLTFSFLCHPLFLKASEQYLMSQVIALSVQETYSLFTDGVTIKWPNDIYWNDKKISGTLIECDLKGKSIANCIVGTGMNVNQERFVSDAPNPVSLKMITGKEHDLGEILGEVCRRFLAYVASAEQGGADAIRRQYKQRLFRREGMYPYEDAHGRFTASIVDVENSGRLLLKDTENRVRRYEFKELKFII